MIAIVLEYNFCRYRDNQYNGFGLSGSDASTLMLGADAIITWVDDDSGPHAEDYYLNEYLQVDRHRHTALCVQLACAMDPFPVGVRSEH